MILISGIFQNFLNYPGRLLRVPGIIFCAILFAALSFFSSCSEDSALGLDTQPPGDKLNGTFSDTTSLVTYIQKEDSVRSDEALLSLLGSYSDSIFGISNASFYTQVLLTGSNVDLGDSLVIDSVVLSLRYSGYYGDTGTQLKISVHELTESLVKDSTYYSNRNFTYDPAPAATVWITPRPGDSVLIGGVKSAPQLRIALDTALFGNKLLKTPAANFTDNASFLNYFKGLYIKADPITVQGQGSVLYFDPYSSYSKITVYYKSGTEDSLSYSFEINSSCARINHFEHDYNGTIIAQNLTDSTLGKNQVHIQAMSGVKTKIVLPHLKKYTENGAASINRAELIITAESGTTSVLSPPSKLTLAAIDSTGSIFFLTDELEGTSYFGGTYTSSTREYRFNIARHVQEVLSGKTFNGGLWLLASGSAVSANRAAIGGSAHPTYRMKLNLIYTRL